MRHFPLLVFALVSAFVFTACTADGLVDTDRLKRVSERIQEKLPSKEEFAKMAEDHIATLPADERAKAREDLRKALAEWPTDAEIDRKLNKAIDHLAETAPTRTEVDEALSDAGEHLPTKDELRDVIDRMPDEGEIKTELNNALRKFMEVLDSVATEIEEGDR